MREIQEWNAGSMRLYKIGESCADPRGKIKSLEKVERTRSQEEFLMWDNCTRFKRLLLTHRTDSLPCCDQELSFYADPQISLLRARLCCRIRPRFQGFRLVRRACSAWKTKRREER